MARQQKTQLLTFISICSLLVYFSFYNRAVIQDFFSTSHANMPPFDQMQARRGDGDGGRDSRAAQKTEELSGGFYRVPETPDTSLRRLARGLFQKLPEPFSKKYKNPCWNVRHKPRQCLPYFYLIGMPKCGTTDVWNKLIAHPHVVETGKEPHWWSRVRIVELKRGWDRLNEDPGTYYKRWANALNNYAEASKQNISKIIVGDGSASTMWDNQHWKLFYPNLDTGPPHVNGELIVTIHPDARAIAILRNPADRLYSDYLFFTDESMLSPQHFHERVKVSIIRFHKCVAKLDLRTCTYSTSSINKYVRIEVGLYSVYIGDWLSFFPRKRLKIISMEAWHQNCLKSLIELHEFLELERLPPADVFRICTNDTKNMRSPEKQLLGPMLPETKRLLDEFYAPYNRELVRLVGNPAFMWADEPTESEETN
ncbi:carbohydrate sulfotransferase 15-like [Diadema antillarum]|uniref:carbohydrate sulfotransferase 15-like n=1 Tax=Diadema antillarum TaxID=105358 RepID=UPI003A880358